VKIFLFLFIRNRDYLSPSRLDQEGRFAVVTDVEAGCGGRVDVAAWFIPRRRTASMRTVKSRGPGIPTLMPR
jgi:hypothetical protein